MWKTMMKISFYLCSIFGDHFFTIANGKMPVLNWFQRLIGVEKLCKRRVCRHCRLVIFFHEAWNFSSPLAEAENSHYLKIFARDLMLFVFAELLMHSYRFFLRLYVSYMYTSAWVCERVCSYRPPIRLCACQCQCMGVNVFVCVYVSDWTPGCSHTVPY